MSPSIFTVFSAILLLSFVTAAPVPGSNIDGLVNKALKIADIIAHKAAKFVDENTSGAIDQIIQGDLGFIEKIAFGDSASKVDGTLSEFKQGLEALGKDKKAAKKQFLKKFQKLDDSTKDKIKQFAQGVANAIANQDQ